ncbi:MAG TPA: hypothetical protein VJH92_01045 [Candidatus Nanoarchaeia archaeon]|nr:hypothetical protein [Candidatus Nanoarchaeia archaeon]
MVEKISKLERISAKIAGAIVGGEFLLAYNNYDRLHLSTSLTSDRFRWLPIENSYFGDVPEIFAANVVSGFVGNKIEEYGHRTSNRFIETMGRYFPTLTAAAVGAYYTLGETIFPQILPGTPDSKDVPAVIVASIASPIVTNYLRKKWPEWKEKILNTLENWKAENAR